MLAALDSSMRKTRPAPARSALLKTARFSTGVIPARYGDDHARSQAATLPGRLLDEILQHRFAEFKVGNHAVLEGPDGRNRIRRATEHLLRQLSDRCSATENLPRPFLQRDNGRFVNDDPGPLQGHERVRRPQVNPQVGAHPLTEPVQHPCRPRD